MFRALAYNAQRAKHLRLRPAMHRHVVPAEMQAAGAERAVGLDPVFQNSGDDRVQCGVELGETIAQQQTEIDAFRAIVELAFVDSQARGFRKWFGKPVFGKEILQIVTNAFPQRFERPRRQRFLTPDP